MMFKIRLVEEKDNLEIEKIIRDYLIEYGANYEGFIFADEDLDKLSLIYSKPKTAYYVAVDEDGNIVGGCGVGKIEGVENTCELQKMFCIKSVRETSVVKLLLDACLSFAKKYYNSVYLEILENMDDEKEFFEKNRFKKTNERLGNKGHCNYCVPYLLRFKTAHFLEELFGELFGELLAGVILIGLGALAYVILPDKITKNVDFEILMLIGAIIMIGVPILIGLVIEFIRKRKKG